MLIGTYGNKANTGGRFSDRENITSWQGEFVKTQGHSGLDMTARVLCPTCTCTSACVLDIPSTTF